VLVQLTTLHHGWPNPSRNTVQNTQSRGPGTPLGLLQAHAKQGSQG